MKKSFLYLFLIIAIFLTGCIQEGIKDNQVYIVKKDNISSESGGNRTDDRLDTEGRIPFQEYEEMAHVNDDLGRILLTIAPDNTKMYFMEPMDEENQLQVIKGEPMEKVRILEVDTETKEERMVVEDIPFVSLVKWNNRGDIVAFGGGERLTVYDTRKNKLLLEDKLKNDIISYFFWSPKDENKLYSEHPNLANASIYYVDSQKKVEAYETREDIYFKGKLDNNYYYATKWYVTSEKRGKTTGKTDSIKTVIVDKKGNIIKILAEGLFRDAYKKSLVQVGEGGFGLYYIEDINNSNKVKTLTKEYIYDVKFVGDGKIAYIVENKDIEKNSFFLHIVDRQGTELKKLVVSGGSIALLPDGKTGYIGGPKWEKVNFVENKITESSISTEIDKEKELEREAIFKTLRGAMDTLSKYEMIGVKDWSAAKKYFIDTNSPSQWAYFDIISRFKDTSISNSQDNNKLYRIKIKLKDLELDLKEKRASVSLRVSSYNFSGGGLAMDYALELIKKQDSWYVTGFSTFPYSAQREEVKQKVEKYVQEAQSGKIFPGKLENKEVEIGQIQFWRSSMPHLSPDVRTANFCKVYLKVKENGREEIYKLVLDRKNQNYWKPTKLTKENLSYL